MKTPFLVGLNVYLRPLGLKDLEGNYVDWLNDPEVSANNSHHIFPYTREQAEEYIQKAYTGSSKLVLAVNLKESDVHIGNIALQQIDFRNQCAEFAVLFGEKDYWGKGYSKEAARLIMKHGFDSLNLRRIYCGTFAENIAMQKLADFLGFKREGVRREAFFKDGKFVDIWEYGVLRDEFVG
ncbi:GNAT family N-acetyltransferase [Geobacter sp.]|uniref:GNAT family N-acetyltransferase n=1 Tax=Geobacter sp. TaxID=46610 RepID=UPI0027B9F04A|nr:GNAT family protein [Geobacter sp.]